MEVRIGIKQSPRELAFETNASAEEVRGLFETAAAKDSGLVALVDTKGRQYLVSADSVTYVELGGEAGRRVGFVS
ncbi:DUF3107 domain-containing protein [Leucobacter luti]|uniref:Uncharacterized protein DUF3107 n=1 Tax=Leucobacter luti TaxID=340320 RepID=A0A4R6RSR8_9MICO|nr:DUF3107 domain-containing protein [Leucobacter luti]MCW2287471.1 hypothetical protein [Leucobacter luti]QYM76487.1 DUF3107 domain-containing protein [Leucobacter luti]TCK41693.1 uncharacterized protein DUF3107 [Leucobacter luti]TDP89337.1 uncharacterized protein DUF3107 [Leucobacter luti]